MTSVTPSVSHSWEEAYGYAAAEIQELTEKTGIYMRAKFAAEKAGEQPHQNAAVIDTHAGLATAGRNLRQRLHEEGLREDLLRTTFDDLMRDSMDQARRQVLREDRKKGHVPQEVRSTAKTIANGTAPSTPAAGRGQ